MSKLIIDRALLAIVLACGGCLFALYFLFLSYFAPTISSLTNPIELFILYTLFLRAVLLFTVPRIRRLPGQLKIGIFSIESFALILIIVWYIFTGDPSVSALIGAVLTSWIAGGLIVITPYSILEFMIVMYKPSTITNVITFMVAEFASVVFLANIAFQVFPPPSNLQQLGITLLTSIKAEPGSGITQLAPLNLVVSTAAVILYLCMILYIVLRHGVAGRTPNVPFALMLIGTVALFAWSSIASIADLSLLVSLTAPAAGIPLIFWVVLRGKK